MEAFAFYDKEDNFHLIHLSKVRYISFYKSDMSVEFGFGDCCVAAKLSELQWTVFPTIISKAFNIDITRLEYL